MKYLGITVEENLTWNEHYTKLKCEIKTTLSSFQKLKNIQTQSELYQVHKALFESHLRYRDEIGSNLSNTKLQHLQRLQTRAKTLIETSRLKDGWRCNWLSVSSIIQFDRAVMIYTIVNFLWSDNLRGRLVYRSQLSSYSTRNQLDLDISRLNLEFSKNNIFYSGVHTWNNIPLENKTSLTINTFKRLLKEFLQK